MEQMADTPERPAYFPRHRRLLGEVPHRFRNGHQRSSQIVRTNSLFHHRAEIPLRLIRCYREAEQRQGFLKLRDINDERKGLRLALARLSIGEQHTPHPINDRPSQGYERIGLRDITVPSQPPKIFAQNFHGVSMLLLSLPRGSIRPNISFYGIQKRKVMVMSRKF